MLYKSKTFELLELLDIVGMYYGYCSMGIVVWAQEAVFIHICIIVIILDCIGQVSCRCFIWVEIPVQRRLCPIF